MFLSDKEKEFRYQLLMMKMTEQNLDALIVRGSSSIRGEGANFRFLTDFPNINIPLVLIFFNQKNSSPIMLLESALQAQKAKQHSWIKDVRLSNNFLQSIIGIIEKKGLVKATVGTDGLDRFPLLWFQELKKLFPDFRLVDFSQPLKKMREYKTEEEIRLVKKSAALVDLAFKEGLRYIKPGNTEREVIAQIDLRLKRYGAEKSFNIISQGPEIVAYTPSVKKLRKRGMVFVEISSCYGGYWTQLARSVSLGPPSRSLIKLHKVAVEAKKECLKYLKPGSKVSLAMAMMEKYVKESGLDIKPIYGHITGLDLIEDRPSPQNETEIAPNMVFIIHPFPVLGKSSILWGETYIINKKGNVRLNKIDDKMVIIN